MLRALGFAPCQPISGAARRVRCAHRVHRVLAVRIACPTKSAGMAMARIASGSSFQLPAESGLQGLTYQKSCQKPITFAG